MKDWGLRIATRRALDRLAAEIDEQMGLREAGDYLWAVNLFDRLYRRGERACQDAVAGYLVAAHRWPADQAARVARIWLRVRLLRQMQDGSLGATLKQKPCVLC